MCPMMDKKADRTGIWCDQATENKKLYKYCY